MEKFKTNPFDRTALTDVKLLAGRASEMRQIRFILKNASKELNRIRHILITGNRGVGKTSFLNLIEQESSGNNLIPIRINLTEGNSSNSNEFFWYIFNQTINTMFGLGLLCGKGGIIDAAIQNILHSDGLKDQANWIFRTPILRKNYLTNNNSTFEFDLLVNDLRLIRKEISETEKREFNEKTKLIFLVDETQHIYSNSKIIEDIRYIVQHPDLGIGFVFAGDSSYETSVWENIFGGSHRDFEIINLAYFNDIEAIKEYFKKSLESIGWTSDEVEKTLFYKFNDACREIFHLTSGKPAWINTIAMKMFERCMRGEVKLLRFDKQAQNDVKNLLEKSGQLDSVKLDIIESLSPKLQKWLAELFYSELRTLNKIYFYAKFKLIEDNYLDKTEYRNFCKFLVENGIIVLLEEVSENSIGFKSRTKELDFLDKPFLAFDLNADTIKQWLQISSNGKYGFAMISPDLKFITYVNKELVTEKCNLLYWRSSVFNNEEPFRLSNEIIKINTNEPFIKEMSFEETSFLYKSCKKLYNSRDRQILYGQLKNPKSGKTRSWNLLNFDDNDKTIGFYIWPKKIQRMKQVVESFKADDHDYLLDINIDTVKKPDLNKLQDIIINTKDKKKLGIILDDKGQEMAKFYIKEANIESSYKNAIFLYKLFEDGIDLDLRYMNNVAYVFLAKNELEQAFNLLNDALRRISTEDQSTDYDNTVSLILYNLAIAHIKKGDYQKGNDSFEKVINYCTEKENVDGPAEVLNILNLDENNELIIAEIKEGDPFYKEITCSSFAEHNIEILKKSNKF